MLSIDHSSRCKLKVYIIHVITHTKEKPYTTNWYFSQKLIRQWKSKEWGKCELQCVLIFTYSNPKFKGCRMGPPLVLVSPCFRQNVVVTYKMGSFLCSLDNLLQKNVIVFFFGNQISKWRSFEKRAIFDLLFTFFSHQGKVTKIPSAHISLTYIHVFCSPYWLFLPYQFGKKYKFIRYGFSLVWVLVLILIRAILEQSINNKWWAKFKLECLLLICTYPYAKFIVICKPRTLNDRGEDSVKYRNRKKEPLLSSSHFAFYR